MTQIKRYVLLAVFAIIITAESFALWSGVVTGSILSRMGVLSVNTIQRTMEKIEIHESAVEEKQVKTEQAVIVPIKKELKALNKSRILDRIFLNQKNRELAQWGIKNWYSISIPSLKIRAPVFLPDRRYWNARKWDLLEEQMQVGLLYGTTAYPHSVLPGLNGSVIISGHSSPPNDRAKKSSYGKIFATLPNINRGDKITLAGQGIVVTYRVVRIRVVNASNTEILAQQSEKGLLKLITCYPIGTSQKRLIVIAERVEE